ncbi:MAG: bifunctional metallophosphatase/5'-nucleotidase [Oligoflexia bacterium]|nr:bifunctional metallophosphatase/5'-nucleotidase [Oligoflexia bacterium]
MILALLWFGCAPKVLSDSPQSGPPSGHAPPGTLVLAHTNDQHVHFLPERAEWLEDQPLLGGMVAIDARLRALRQAEGADAVLYLDAGDLLTGTPLMELEIDGVSGGGMAELMNAVHVDGWVLGNHDFDKGFDNAVGLVAAMDAPMVDANLRAPCGLLPMQCGPAIPGTEPWRIYTVNGLKVGVFGLTTSALSHLTDSVTMARMSVVDHATAARAAVAELEPQVDLVVALTHIGIKQDRALARDVDGIDLIVGGHSHTRMDAPEHVGDTWIVQAGSYGRLLGIGEIAVDHGDIASISWRAEELHPDSLAMAPDPEVVALVDEYKAALDARFGQPAGTLSAPLARAPGPESPMGRWAADVVRSSAGADIGLYNPGGLRADLAAGPLTVGDLYDVFPFGNQVVTFQVTGSELVGILLSTVGATLEGNRGPLQWSGVQATWRVHMGAPELVSAMVGGADLDIAATYLVATNSFVASQWQHNLGVAPGPVTETGHTVLDAAIATATGGSIVPPPNWRLRQVGAD